MSSFASPTVQNFKIFSLLSNKTMQISVSDASENVSFRVQPAATQYFGMQLLCYCYCLNLPDSKLDLLWVLLFFV